MTTSRAPSRAQHSRAFRFDDLWGVDRLGTPVPAPAGGRLVLPVTSVDWLEPDEQSGQRLPHEQTRTDLWLVDADAPEAGARRLTFRGGKSPAWSPCGRWLYFVRQPPSGSPQSEGPAAVCQKTSPKKNGKKPTNGDRETVQLWRLPMDGPGEAQQLTRMATAVSSPRAFQDGRHVAFVADTWPDVGHDLEALARRVDEVRDDPVQARASDRRLVRYWDEYRTDGRVPHVFVLDLETGVVRDAMAGIDGLLHFMDFRWDLHPDGVELAFARNATAPPWQEVRLEVAILPLDVAALFAGEDAQTAEPAAPFARDGVWDNAPAYLPDGRLAFLRNLRPEVSADFSRLMVWDRESAPAELLPGWDGDPGGVEPLGDDAVVFLAQERGRQHLFATGTRSPSPEPARLGAWQDGSVVAARPFADGRVACLRQSFHRPSELCVVGRRSRPATRLGRWNDELVAAIDFGPEPEDVTFEVPRIGADGVQGGTTEAQMFVLHPPGFDPSRRWPLVLLLHGGPHSAWLDSFHQRWNAALLAAGGRIVAALNPHGSTGFGQAYAEAIVGRHADQPFADAMAAVDLLLARGSVDQQRMAVAGGSYGGYLTSWVIGHTDRFAAAICHAGVYDLMAQFASDYTWSRGKNYGAEPWQDPTAIDRQSPSRFAGAFTTPTLVLHGEKDYRVPVTQGLNLFQVLQGKGVPSRLVVFPKENHWILEPRAAQLWWREVAAWLEKWIGSGPTQDEPDGAVG